jgi:aminopeptidase N
VLVSQTHANGKATWVWRESDPMAPYLATATLGKFDLTTSPTDGIPTYVAVDPQLAKGQVLSKLPDAVRFYGSIYGPYPFNAVGAIVDSANKSVHQWFERWYSTSAKDTAFWGPAVADFTDPALLFNGTVYLRGGMTLQALREKIGDFAFFDLLRTWATQNRYGNVRTPQFIALAEKISGQDLTQFFHVWIYQADKPAPGNW